MAKSKKKMSNRKFSIIMGVSALLSIGVAVGASVAANYWRNSLDTYVGRGTRRVSNVSGTENWDTDYYKVMQKDGKDINTLDHADEVSKNITDEGIVLMKNNGVLPLAKNSKVAPFGARYRFPVFGGTGSGAVNTSDSRVWFPSRGLKKSFQVNSGTEDAINSNTTWRIASTADRAADYRETKQVNPDGFSSTGFEGADCGLYEFDPSIYDGVSIDKDKEVGIVYLGRLGGEGDNPIFGEYLDGTPHYLALSQYEKETVRFAKEHCRKVVAVINSSNVMEISELMQGELECDGIVWIGGPGTTGFESLTDVLDGDVNPSGRTVDIWDADLSKNPTMQNFGDHSQVYTGTENDTIWPGRPGIHYFEYEEGVYYGYRYYETAAKMDSSFKYGKLDGKGGLTEKGAVDYPFGYGLSYTSFEQSIGSYSESGDEIKIGVRVKNTGSIAGKEVVQIYSTAPYTDFDIRYKIEKPVKVLAAFTKTKLLNPGEEETVELTIKKEDLASYCYTRDNPDGTRGAYVLEEGTYTLTLGKNSHDEWDARTTKIPATVWYDSTNPRQSEKDAQAKHDDDGRALDFPAAADSDKNASFVAAHNQFPELEEYMNSEATIFTRSNWANTFPSKPTGEHTLADKYVQEYLAYDYKTDAKTGDVEGSAYYNKYTSKPVTNADNGLSLTDMRGVDYYDSTWDEYMDQLDMSQASALFTKGAFGYSPIESLGIPAVSGSDGPQGFGKTGVDSSIGSFAYCSETVVASTWNTDLAYDYGESIGQEALYLNINIWYGPGMNLHRSPFNGRNFEYYSEEPLLTGMLGANCISGAEQQGLIVFSKHLGINDHETESTNMMSWMTEQAYRETDLKAFEIAHKNAKHTISYIADQNGTVKQKTIVGASGAMPTDNMLGATIQSSNYGLITGIMREEWGFTGLISSDMYLYSVPQINDKLLRAGTDLKMFFMPSELTDKDSPTTYNLLRNAMKHVAYAYANSNVTNGAAPGAIVSYSMSPWEIGIISLDCVLGAWVLASCVWTGLRIADSKKNPDKYNH